MNAISELLASSSWQAASAAICHGLFHSVWQGCASALVYLLLTKLMRLGPVERHRLGCALLFVLPVALGTSIWRGLSRGATALPVLQGNHADASRGAELVSATGPSQISLGAAWWGPGESLVAALWLGVCLLLGLRAALELLRTQRWVRDHRVPLAAEWLGVCERIASELGVAPRVRFLGFDGAGAVPFTYGWLRPLVVLPLSLLTQLPRDAMEAVIRHELAHVARWHYLSNLLQSLAETCLFFHPAVHWLGAQVRKERELCCDLDVFASGSGALSYARALLMLEESRGPSQGPFALHATGAGLRERIERIVLMKTSQDKSIRQRVTALGAQAVVALGLGGAAAIACTSAVDADEVAAPTSQHQEGSLEVAWLPPSVAQHAERIERVAAQHAEDPALIALMVLVESGGETSAQSPVGALGLMQLMPATARGVAARMGEPLSSERALLDPELNLELGVRLVAELRKVFSDRPDGEQRRLIWSAYNAGAQAVDAHLNRGEVLPEETRRYVALLESLYSERQLPVSKSYEAWRARARARAVAPASPPVKGARTSSPFGLRGAPLGSPKAEEHAGVDLALAAGEKVVAALDGVVTRSGPSGDARGVVVELKHASQLTTHYYHLGSTSVTVGERVRAGQQLGLVGSSGATTGPHLHFELRDQGRAIDPSTLLKATD